MQAGEKETIRSWPVDSEHRLNKHTEALLQTLANWQTLPGGQARFLFLLFYDLAINFAIFLFYNENDERMLYSRVSTPLF